MILAKVIGPIVMTDKHPAYHGEKVLLVQPINADGSPQGDPIAACDRVQAGEDDHVLVLREGSGIRQILGKEKELSREESIAARIPIRSLIVAFVDQVDVQ